MASQRMENLNRRPTPLFTFNKPAHLGEPQPYCRSIKLAPRLWALVESDHVYFYIDYGCFNERPFRLVDKDNQTHDLQVSTIRQ